MRHGRPPDVCVSASDPLEDSYSPADASDPLGESPLQELLQELRLCTARLRTMSQFNWPHLLRLCSCQASISNKGRWRRLRFREQEIKVSERYDGNDTIFPMEAAVVRHTPGLV